MKSRALLVVCLSVLMPSASQAADTNPPPRLTVELRDGSRVIGESVEKNFRFHSALLGDLKPAVKDLQTVDCITTNSAKLTTTGGDTLTVLFVDSTLALKTEFGKVALATASIRKLNISSYITLGTKNYGNHIKNTPNLLGYWRFDAVFQTNSCVHGYTGELQGSAKISPADSGVPQFSDPASHVLSLDGNGYFTTSLTGQIDNQGTILVWVYLTAQPSNTGQIFSIVSQSQYGNDLDFQIQTDNHVYFFTDQGSSTIYAQSLPLNQWHFLAATFVANSTRNIYLDGQLVATTSCGEHAINNNPFWIGNNQVFGPRCFQGQIGEVAIFNRALSATEINTAFAMAAKE